MHISKTSENSLSMQAGKNININHGMSFEAVKSLVDILVSSKLPEISEKLMKNVDDNLEIFSANLHKEISESNYDYDPDKLTQPDVLFALRQATQRASLKGNKIDLETLVSLIEQRLQDNDDSKDFDLETAIEAVSQIPPKLIKTLAVIFAMKSPFMITILTNEEWCVKCVATFLNGLIFKNEFDVKKSEMMILQSKGLIFDNQKPLGIPEWGDKFDNYESFEKIKEKHKVHDSHEDLTDVEELYENFGKSGLNRYYLTVPGQLIAMSIIENIVKFDDKSNYII